MLLRKYPIKMVKPRVRALPSENKDILNELILLELDDFQIDVETIGMSLFDCGAADNKCLVEKIIKGIECIKTESDLLETYSIWNEQCSFRIISLIDRYAPLIGDSQN